jgi:hypothetical protein
MQDKETIFRIRILKDALEGHEDYIEDTLKEVERRKWIVSDLKGKISELESKDKN